MYLPALNDDELIRFADSTLDPLTSTELERELLKRFTALLDAEDDYAPIYEIIDKYEIEGESLKTISESIIGDFAVSAAMLDIIINAGIDTPHELKTQLDIARQFSAITEDAGDLFTRLSLTTK